MSTLAEKMDLLFRTFVKPDGSQYTYQEVEDGTNKAVTAAYVWRLRMGKAQNPSYKVLEALGEFFGAPIGYFSSRETASDEHLQNLRLAQELRKAGVAQIALRASDLDEAAKKDLLAMIEYIRKAQGLRNGAKGSGHEAEHHGNPQDAGPPG